VGRLILVDEPIGEAGLGARTAVYARVSSADQVVVDAAEVDDDLVRDRKEILTSMCARRYGRRAAGNRAKRTLAAAAAAEERGAA